MKQKIKVNVNGVVNTFECLKTKNTYKYIDNDCIIIIDVDNNIIRRKNKEYEINLNFKEKDNVCYLNNNKFILEIKVNKICKENGFYVNYEIIGGDKIIFKMEEIND